MNDQDHLDAVRRRQADPDLFAGAERRLAAINKKMQALGINKTAQALQQAPRARKFIWLRRVTGALGAAAAGIAPCKAGCSHCCHMATLISTVEAEAIAQATGLPLTMPPDEEFMRGDASAERAQYEGKPCSMLKAGKCSIYAERPFACRVHYSLDRDNLLCRIVPGTQIRTPSINPDRFHLLYLLAHGDPMSVRMADIRAFFPPRQA
jgi:Fe-S-cluster containining protein